MNISEFLCFLISTLDTQAWLTPLSYAYSHKAAGSTSLGPAVKWGEWEASPEASPFSIPFSGDGEERGKGMERWIVKGRAGEGKEEERGLLVWYYRLYMLCI